jgi:hypothetical protein
LEKAKDLANGAGSIKDEVEVDIETGVEESERDTNVLLLYVAFYLYVSSSY